MTRVVFSMALGIEVPATLSAARCAGGRCEIDVEFDPATWLRIDGGLLFHLADIAASVRTPIADGRPVLATLRLADDVAGSLPTLDESTLTAMLGDERDDDLHAVRSWFLTRSVHGAGRKVTEFVTPFAEAPTLTRDDGAQSDVSLQVEVPSQEASELIGMTLAVLRQVDLPAVVEGRTLLRIPLVGDVPCQAYVHDRDGSQLMVYATSQTPIDRDRRPVVMELLTRLNQRLSGSWFELDLDRGTVSARATLLLEGIALQDDTFVENVVYAATQTFERYWPLIEAVGVDGKRIDLTTLPDDGDELVLGTR